MECPTCEKSLATERGMRQHHTKVHDEPLPNRTCKGCEVEFYDPKSRRVYCDDCNPNAGEHNGNWKGAKETAECRRCRSTFEYYPSDKEGVYCSDCVEAATEFLGDPYWEVHEIERIERDCNYCGEKMNVLRSTVNYGHGKFCSQDCLAKWLSEQWDGAANDYNGKWREIRRQALDRDDHQCQKCGITSDQLGREPDVHHIIPVRLFNDPQTAHHIHNVVCLCKRCHRLVEIGKKSCPTVKMNSN